jgi:hypothetical protein
MTHVNKLSAWHAWSSAMAITSSLRHHLVKRDQAAKAHEIEVSELAAEIASLTTDKREL